MSTPVAVVVSARRTALGRVGGLHRLRRVEELAEPALKAALADAQCEAKDIAGLLVGNTGTGGNAARAIALAVGLSETAYAVTLDSQCASGLDAILDAIRRVSAGELEMLVAGGAESLSTAPWRIARPKNPYQTPHFTGYRAPGMEQGGGQAEAFEADEALARKLGISRQAQDGFVVQSQLVAEQARERRQFIGEIAGARATPEEMRDQSGAQLELEDLKELPPYHAPEGTVTAGNSSTLADGAAFAVVVSGSVWAALGRPKGLALVRSLACGVAPANAAGAGIFALDALLQRGVDKAARDVASLAAIETCEASAAEALAMIRGLRLSDGVLNAGGGALVRGLPLGAAGAVGFTRLYTRLVRQPGGIGRLGAVTQRATGGIGVAAIFEAVG